MQWAVTGRVMSIAISIGLAMALAMPATAVERRNEVSYLRGPYNIAFFKRHNASFRVAAALHFSHAKQHDVLLLTPFAQHAEVDAQFDQESVDFLQQLYAHTEPTQEYYAPYTARAAWQVLRAID
jgi:hypothetical protein